MDVITIEKLLLLRVISSPIVVGSVVDLIPEDHEETMADIITVIATIKITPITGETPLSSLQDSIFFLCILNHHR